MTVATVDDKDTLAWVAVLVPAHNEAAGIRDTIESLLQQTYQRTLILVISDNSTDNTYEIAREYGQHDVLAMKTMFNEGKKGGAMEQGIRYLELLRGVDPGFIMTMDADSWVDRRFVERAVRSLRNDPRLGAITGAVLGKPNVGQNLYQKVLCWLQEVELAQYAHGRMLQQIFTLSGAGTLYRADALVKIRDVNEGRIFVPGSRVEDFATGLHLKELGYRYTANEFCVCWTDVMPSIRSLIRQRVSWMLGSLGELADMGMKRHTASNIARISMAPLVQPIWAATLALAILAALHGHFALALGPVIFYTLMGAYNGYRAMRMGWKSALVCATNIPMIVYWPFVVIWVYVSVVKLLMGKRARW